MSESPTFTRDQPQGTLRYFNAVRLHWLLITLLLVGSVASAFAFVTTAAKRYEASVDILITPISANDDTYQNLSVFRDSLTGSSTVVTAARILKSPAIQLPAMRAVEKHGTGITIAINPVSQADAVVIKATAPTALQAQAGANEFAHSVIRLRYASFQRGLHREIIRLRKLTAAVPVAQRATNFEFTALAQRLGVLESFFGGPDPTVQLVSDALAPTAASWPRTKLTLAAAFMAALLLGIGIAVLLEFANPRISREEELQLVQRLPILARIPKLSSWVVQGYLLGEKQLPSAAWKGYRTLRAVLATAGRTGGFPRTILVTSASPGDGKTMTAVNLAITLAASDLRVILVDADLHRPMVATIFHVATRGDGFTGVLSGRIPVEAALVPAPTNPRLSLLLARREHVSNVGLFDASRVESLLHRLSDKADLVIIDSPPLPEVAEALEFAAAVDAVLLAVRLGHTNRDRLNQLREMLARRGVSPVGLVVTTRRSAQAESPYDYGGSVTVEPEETETLSGRRGTIVRLQDR